MASKLFDDVKNYNVRMECIPTFEELRDIEMCRVVGAQNMFDTNSVMRWLYDRNLYAGIQ